MPITIGEVQLLARPDRARTKVAILGVGGVGTNLLTFLARLRGRQVAIYDHDTVELHNLNRTRLFRLADVGRRKVDAAAQTANQISYALSSERVVSREAFLEVDSGTQFPSGSVVIDARDTMDATKMHAAAWLKVAYDGGSNIGFTFKPAIVAGKLVDLGGAGSYEVVPSFFVPAALLALLALNFMRYLNFLEITDMRAGTCNVDIDEAALSVSFEWRPEEEEQEEAAAGGAAQGAEEGAEA